MRRVMVMLNIGEGESRSLKLPGVNYKTTFPKIIRLRFHYDYHTFAGQGSIPAMFVQLQTNTDGATLEPDAREFICRAALVPSVLLLDGAFYVGAFDASKDVFSEILSRAPIVPKQLYIKEGGVFNAPTPFWTEISYESVTLDGTKVAQLLLGIPAI